jgi:hypothetical protein
LQELLKDPRTPGLRRHLRKIFVDPATGGTEWGIVYLADHVGVIGVYSLSQARPLKIGNFDPRLVGFENKQHLSDWKFTAGLPPAAPPPMASAVPVPPLMVPAPPKTEPAGAAPEPVVAPPEPEEEEKTEEKNEPAVPPPTQQQR